MRTPLVLAILLAAPSSQGAKLAAAVERRFELSGEDARAFAKVLGLPADRRHDAAYPTIRVLGEPPVANRITWTPGAAPLLVIEGRWSDATTTSSMKPVPRYSFVSADVRDDAPEDEPWKRLLASLSVNVPPEPATEPSKLVSERSTPSGGTPLLVVQVYRVLHYDSENRPYSAHQVVIGIDERPEPERAREIRRHRPPSDRE